MSRFTERGRGLLKRVGDPVFLEKVATIAGGVATLATAGSAIGRHLKEYNQGERPDDKSGRVLGLLSLGAAVASEIGGTSGSLQNFGQFTPAAKRQALLDAAIERANSIGDEAREKIASLAGDENSELVIDTETVD
ncbi:MAG TPA: hypothetical protein PKA29_02840 [Candidatus Saccharibacteria bacterium]|nr:hypothetical protein [Candidatus Saccharibacteria bacterium]